MMLAISLIYFILIWKWKPYNEAADFHNKALRLNYFTVVFFVAACEVFKITEISFSVFVIMVYLSLFLMLILSCCAFWRLYVEYQFRKKLEENPKLMDEKKPDIKI